jgi:hypothetical protein
MNDVQRILFRVIDGNASHRVTATRVWAGALGVISGKSGKFGMIKSPPDLQGALRSILGNHHIMSVEKMRGAAAMCSGLPGCKLGARAMRTFAQFAAAFEQRKLPIASDCCQSR